MPTTVGAKGQVVIEKAIRDRLGVKPGAIAVQTLRGDRVEIRFLPPEHAESLFGTLADYAGRDISDRDWQRVKQKAWVQAAREAEPVLYTPARARKPRRRDNRRRPT